MERGRFTVEKLEKYRKVVSEGEKIIHALLPFSFKDNYILPSFSVRTVKIGELKWKKAEQLVTEGGTACFYACHFFFF